MEITVLPATDRPVDRSRRTGRPLPPVRVERLDRKELALWDSFITSHPAASFFHTPAWMESVATAFGHEVIYLIARGGNAIVGALPRACVRSMVGGTMLVSVPYAIYGGVVSDDGGAATALLAAARDEARRVKAKCIDLRSERAAFADLPRIDRYVTFKRQLPDRPDDVAGWLPRKARAAARNARKKFGLTVRFEDEQLPQVWRLYSRSMRRLASLDYPYRFFEELVARSPSRHLVSMVYDGSRPGSATTDRSSNGLETPV